MLETVVRNNSFKTLGTRRKPALSSHDQVIYSSEMVFVGVLRSERAFPLSILPIRRRVFKYIDFTDS